LTGRCIFIYYSSRRGGKMQNDYEINQLGKEESWRMFRIMGELVEGFDHLGDIEPAVTIYGSARLKPDDELYGRVQETARLLGEIGFSIMTGGGPGVMEAANRGAFEAGTKSIGLNISLPDEQQANPFTTRTINFHHFFVRKVMLVKYATAFVIMPGGLGTMDELTEVLTLIQTEKINPFPVILYSSEYWHGFLDWLEKTVLSRGNISPEDFELLRVFDTPKDVAEAVWKWYKSHEITGRKALQA
jgi:uncharacterized protein (TIGR00730 family)